MNENNNSKPTSDSEVGAQLQVIRQGQIWEVVNDGLIGNRDKWEKCAHCQQGYKIYLHEKIPVGMKIEIRFPYAWHYRTEENKYYQSDEDEILKYCRLVGNVREDIKWNNRHNLDEILQQGLWNALAV